MKKIHLILNSHIDPIWLWPWEAGLDTLLATCRSACDRLDANPDIFFTKGEAWVYKQVELVDPVLFERIRKHLENRRWEIVGGWWIQPDCNQPSGWAIEKQIDIGKDYFQKTFGQFPRIAYNVDSFGHAATFPGLLSAAGQDRYIMMRPGQHEMKLPNCLFRWRGYENGPEIVTFRLPSAYGNQDLYVDHFTATVESLPDGIEDTMAFVGVGDHGGGPTEEQIAWCREHKFAVEGWEMEFSTPSRFFDAIADKTRLLPLVTGELQMHAIGCYTVYRPVKVQLRRAEHLMAQAEIAAADTHAVPGAKLDIEKAWQEVCFHHFHDTLGGTCIPSAYQEVADQIGSAAATAARITAYTLRRKATALGDDPLQRIVVWNATDKPFAGYIEFEPWFEGKTLAVGSGLIDESGCPIVLQQIESEAATNGLQRILFHSKLVPNQLRTVRIVRAEAASNHPKVSANDSSLTNNLGIAIRPTDLQISDVTFPRPNIELFDDDSDTWSHGLDRFSPNAIDHAKFHSRAIVDSGPLMASWIEKGTFGSKSEVTAEWRVYADEPYISLDLKIDYHEKHRLVKLGVTAAGEPLTRRDGILGGSLVRANDGRELPLRDWTLISSLGVVSPDTFAADASKGHLRLTLLRSPLMAHHEPHPGDSCAARQTFADQGIHHFRFRFYAGQISESLLETAALELERRPFCANITKGMPTI